MNKESAKIFKGFFTLVMISAVMILPEDVGASVDIHHINFYDGKYWYDGVLKDQPYGFEVMLSGDGIIDVAMTPPGGSPIPLLGSGSNWGMEADDYATLAALRAAFPTGSYVFSFNGGSDSATIPHNPAEPTGFADITYPSDGATDVYLNPIITWSSCVGYGDELGSFLWDATAGQVADLISHVNIAQTSWSPGTLQPGHLHELEVGVHDGTASQPFTGMTNQGDSFEYYDHFEYTNIIWFITVSPVEIDIIAETITPKTKWITCHIWPPEGYDVADIKTDSILLNGEIPAVRTSVRRKQQMLVVKFSAAELNLEPSPELLALTVTGELTDETQFIDSDFVTVVQKGKSKN